MYIHRPYVHIYANVFRSQKAVWTDTAFRQDTNMNGLEATLLLKLYEIPKDHVANVAVGDFERRCLNQRRRHFATVRNIAVQLIER
jgi:hypothetical protein